MSTPLEKHRNVIALSRGAMMLANGSKLDFHTAFVEIADYAAALEAELAEARQLCEAATRHAEMQDGLREALAAYAHEAWAGWIDYMFSKMTRNYLTTLLELPAWAEARWLRQSGTFYADLSEQEKESDRAEADKMIDLMRRNSRRGAQRITWPQGDEAAAAKEGDDG